MSSLQIIGDIGASGFARSGLTALLDLIAGSNAKAIGAIAERKDLPVEDTYKKVLKDEGLEPFWDTFVSSVLVKLAKMITPKIPEQIAMIPGKLLGSAWHWAITSHQSTNREGANNNNNGKPSFYEQFYKMVLEKPSDYVLNFVGLGRSKQTQQSNNNVNFLKYALSQIGVFGLASVALRNSEENLPGVDLSRDESVGKNILKGLGYTIVDHLIYIASQTIRLKTDFEDEFKEGGHVWAKALANTINERAFPGRILSGIAASMSTYFLGGCMPKSTAAVLGEFPFNTLNRLLNIHKRRATKYKTELDNVDPKTKKPQLHYVKDKDGNLIPNYMVNKVLIRISDTILEPCKDFCMKQIAKIFGAKYEDLVDSLTKRLPP